MAKYDILCRDMYSDTVPFGLLFRLRAINITIDIRHLAD